MNEPSWLIDKSALVRLGTSPHAEQGAERIQRGLLHIAAVALLEVGYSARSAQKPAGHRCGFIEYADRVLAEKVPRCGSQ